MLVYIILESRTKKLEYLHSPTTSTLHFIHIDPKHIFLLLVRMTSTTKRAHDKENHIMAQSLNNGEWLHIQPKKKHYTDSCALWNASTTMRFFDAWNHQAAVKMQKNKQFAATSQPLKIFTSKYATLFSSTRKNKRFDV